MDEKTNTMAKNWLKLIECPKYTMLTTTVKHFLTPITKAGMCCLYNFIIL
jgi:hypothetical protein